MRYRSRGVDALLFDYRYVVRREERPRRAPASVAIGFLNRRSGPRPLHRFSTKRPRLSHSHPADYNTTAQLTCLRSMCARRSRPDRFSHI